MSRERATKLYMCDFETTVYTGQEYTEVWAAACSEIFAGDEVLIFNSIDQQFNYFRQQKCNVIAYYHNLKFDGAFWLSYLITVLGYKQAYYEDENGNFSEFCKIKDMPNRTFKYSISDKGMWYSITIKINNRTIELRDSLKLLPFSVREIGKAFKTKHQKLDMEYEGYRYAGCEITDEEKKYIANDVLVVKEALEVMFKQGHNKLTIGSCCLAEYKKIIGKEEYASLYPNLYKFKLDNNLYKYDNAGQYIRKSYRGGWCYLVKEKANRLFQGGITADVNSLYPSVMSGESGNPYPIGLPTFWKGEIPDEAKDKYFFVRLRTSFRIKDGYLPFVQIKHSPFYKPNECLRTSDIYDESKGKYVHYRETPDGRTEPITVELTLTMTDYYLLLEHYDLRHTEILDGCWFNTKVGLFDEYIDKYRKIKMESKGALRTLAKLFLNNLYGKMATSPEANCKFAIVGEDGVVHYAVLSEGEKEPGFIAIGSAITSYARNFTIRTAQKNYHKNGRGFIYADTDSIHCDLRPEELVDVPVHPTAFLHWKIESSWDVAIFARQKTYIEHIVAEDLEPVDSPYYNIKCAGMPEHCKRLLELSMTQSKPKEDEKLSESELEWIATKRELKDFKTGLKVPGKLMPKRIRGGIVLKETTYEMRDNSYFG